VKRCYIFDIDGTLANCQHRLHHIEKSPKDWAAFFDACEEDPTIEPIADLARLLFSAGNTIVFCTGRSSEYLEKTSRWLAVNNLYGHAIYMRDAGDHRADNEVKGDLLAAMRADGYDPVMAFEDRSSVVTMWRERGIPCAQVAPGNF
jgi:phosphoglycolate phosphatase-like HAD superfamily hydrolase